MLVQSYNKIVADNYPDILQLGLLKHHSFDGSLKKTEWMPIENFDYKYYRNDMTKDDYVIKMLQEGNIRAEAASKFIRRDFIIDNGLAYQSVYSAREDGDFAIRITRKAQNVSTLKIPSFIYYLPREGSISTASTYKTQKSVIRFYSNFYSELELWDFTEVGLKYLNENKQTNINHFRRGTLTYPIERSKEECFKLTSQMEQYFGKEFRNLSVGIGITAIEKIAFLIYKIFGIKYGFRLLYYPFYYWLSIKKTTK